ncbi:MAG: hypothetical protein A2043_05825 [Candidatus Schekmanbacteria bacterium GWA2_38_9]|uniref:Uncharacterized protein n=1 Tax=Candidatus Schekmanbacteria bacterium RIFCSPLOWO2_12_FULL_38_15 TaxID=1817883 RepID=A0A1F7SMR5_9BACT|nr:MAG: hypothetical protein A2043_05825 [Candidatus Schekmanbacteria bacterium GWA2_38_9]OGL48018.1 MAG: hypothetical protein A3H37_08315 [Candidatus Schekmanbacteria bacterium RIFCSPLOWO2_02_FULL_38_14]OGL54497.1 MAG: hypothetical protein A3G31_10075 [Candidatus Schekmanbacteria bacterium RIFCSPLOWO2_12_FULL_38_15]
MQRNKIFLILLSISLIIPLISCESSRKKKEYQKHLSQGEKYYAESDFEKAIEEFRLAAEIDPKSDEAYKNIAVCYSNLFLVNIDPFQKPKRLEIANNAIKYYQKVIELKPNDAEAQLNISSEYAKIGNMYMNDGQFPEAILYLKKRIEIDPNNSEGHYTIGVLDWGLCFDNRKLYNVLGMKDYVNNLKANESAVEKISRVSGISKELVPQVLDAINTDEGTVLGKLDKKSLMSRITSVPKIKKEYGEKAIECITSSPQDIISCIGKIEGIKPEEVKMLHSVLSKSPENLANYIPLVVSGVNKNAAAKAVDLIIDLIKNEAIEDGLKSLDNAIELNKNYPDALNYKVLLYVEKIKLEKDKTKQDEAIKTAADISAQASKLRDSNKTDDMISKEIEAFKKAVNNVRGKSRIQS